MLIFEPLKIKKFTLKNRIVFPPTYTCMGVNSEQALKYYSERAAGGASLVIVEGTDVSVFFVKGFSTKMKRLSEAIKENGAAAVLQLVVLSVFNGEETWVNSRDGKRAITGDEIKQLVKGKEIFFMTNSIVYFEKMGKVNTIETLVNSKKRALELGIRQVLVASNHGYTAKEAARIFEGTGIEVIAVTISEGFKEEGGCMTSSERQELGKVGVKVLTSQLSLSGGVGEAFLGENSPLSIVSSTLYCFSQGMKVAIEIAVMAAEAGYVPTDKEVISIAGTNEGADTAIVLVPSYARKFKELRVREILCKPRMG